jgi:hypothetical protein
MFRCFSLTLICSARRLLSETTSCSNAATIFAPSSPTSGEITVTGTVVCGSGENEVLYDVGTLDANGNFVVTFLSAFSQTVTVSVGLPSAFQLLFVLAKPEQTLTAIRSQIFINALDSGGNVRPYVLLKCLLNYCLVMFQRWFIFVCLI